MVKFSSTTDDPGCKILNRLKLQDIGTHDDDEYKLCIRRVIGIQLYHF